MSIRKLNSMEDPDMLAFDMGQELSDRIKNKSFKNSMGLLLQPSEVEGEWHVQTTMNFDSKKRMISALDMVMEHLIETLDEHGYEFIYKKKK